MITHSEYILGKRIIITLFWSDTYIQKISLDWKTASSNDKMYSNIAQDIKKSLVDYEKGKPVLWPSLPFDFNLLREGSFKKNVLLTLCTIGHGQIISYSELATLSGNPQAARAVGRIMASNPWPLFIPCHRVIAIDGKLTGYTGIQGIEMKKWLLQCEGHMIHNNVIHL